MDLEDALARFVDGQPLAEVPPDARLTAQRVLLAVAGTGVAGAGEDGSFAPLQRQEQQPRAQRVTR